MRKYLSIVLVILVAFTVTAPRALATGVGGAALTLAEMAGVVGLIAGSLGIVFTGAGDMHDACEAFVKGLDPNSAAYLALASAVAQGSTIYIAGTDAINYLGGLVDSVRSFFLPGDNVVVEGSGVSITNMGQIWTGSGDLPADNTDVARIVLTSSPVVFSDNGVEMLSVSFDVQYLSDSYPPPFKNYVMTAVGTYYGDAVNDNYSIGASSVPYYYFAFTDHLILRRVIQQGEGIYTQDAIHFSRIVNITTISGGGGEEAIDIPVFQEPGALAPDLVGGVWDKLAQDAAAQNGNVTIDTNVGTYQGGATGYVDGDPNGVIAAPQAPSLGGVGSTKTETDTSTGTTTQTQTQTGAQAVPQSDTANPAITDVQTQTTFNGAALTLADIFPFCIPFDVYWMLKGFAVGREAPQFDLDLVLPPWLDYTYTFDFSPYERYAQVVRTGELVVFVIGLAAATRKFIKW